MMTTRSLTERQQQALEHLRKAQERGYSLVEYCSTVGLEKASRYFRRSMQTKKPWAAIGLFLALTVMLSSIFYAFIIATGHVGGGNGAYELGLMWSPAVAALLACRVSGISVQSLGWQWGAARWQMLAFAIPLAYTAIAYAGVWLAGFGGFPDPKFIDSTRSSLGWSAAPDWLVISGYFLLIGSAGMVMSMAFALGEEIGWRGFLAPRMTEAFGFKRGALLTGVIWTLWHLPLVFFADYSNSTPWWFAMSCFAVLMLGMSVIMAWLRLTSGTLWTAALFHASHNQFVQVFFTPLTSSRGAITSYAIDEFGFALPATVLIIAVLFWKRSSGLDRVPARLTP
jgi:membrane protease YdiL (CAAX protease family)